MPSIRLNPDDTGNHYIITYKDIIKPGLDFEEEFQYMVESYIFDHLGGGYVALDLAIQMIDYYRKEGGNIKDITIEKRLENGEYELI